MDPTPVVAKLSTASADAVAALTLIGHEDRCDCSVCWSLSRAVERLAYALAEAPGLAQLDDGPCPAGGPHRFVRVEAGIETGLHSGAWLCDECSAHAPEREVEPENRYEYDGVPF
jgi:hypothetical protein